MTDLEPEALSMGQHKIGPVVMVLPVLSLALALVWFHRHPEVEVPGDPPRVSDPYSEIEVWRGTSSLEGGGELRVEVQPLHGDPDRQAFEAEVLRGRFDLGSGEPLRVRMDWLAEGPSEGIPRATLPCESLRIVDGSGVLAAPLEGVIGEAGWGRAPVGALFAVPPGGISVGRGVDLVFWGQRPGEDALLVDGRGEPAASTGPLGRSGMALGKSTRRLMDFPPSLGRFDAQDVSALGKKDGPGASTPPDPLDPGASSSPEPGSGSSAAEGLGDRRGSSEGDPRVGPRGGGR